jgi:hypothetical protein
MAMPYQSYTTAKHKQDDSVFVGEKSYGSSQPPYRLEGSYNCSYAYFSLLLFHRRVGRLLGPAACGPSGPARRPEPFLLLLPRPSLSRLGEPTPEV